MAERIAAEEQKRAVPAPAAPIAQPVAQVGGREEEIRQVMKFTGCSREKALEAFKRMSTVERALAWVLEN